ncbi:MAG: hypothetical protein NTV49_00355, partial [Kiritimatiellaeota bacterium]|nr:hypothetical protein [Kiritimatiellota bacterium]
MPRSLMNSHFWYRTRTVAWALGSRAFTHFEGFGALFFRHRFSVLLVMAVACLFLMHRGSYVSYVRYTRVAEGNISHCVAGFWAKGWPAFRATIVDDAQVWGRIRPAHWLFHQIPFAITLLRNGDCGGGQSGVKLADRINGDLQTHTLVLLATLSLAAAGAAYVLLSVAGSWWAVLVFMAGFAGSLTISENLLVNYCDSGEIAQLLWIGTYGVALTVAWRSKGWRLAFAETGAVLCLLLAYTAKETSVVLLPIAVALACWLLWRRRNLDGMQSRLIIRQLAWHIGLAATILIMVHRVKSGASVSAHFHPAKVDYVAQVHFALGALRWGLDGIRMGMVSLAVLGAMMLIQPMRLPWKDRRGRACVLFVLVALSGGLAFMVINLPWQAILAKYFIMASFFLALGFAAVQVLIVRGFSFHGMRWAGWVWTLVISLFLIRELG